MVSDAGGVSVPRPMTVWRAVALGIGSMVGAGIFALLGEVGAVAGASVWFAFLAGGIVALLNGYSYGRLGARYPSAGGPVDYLARGYGEGVFSGGLSIFYYAAGVIGMAINAALYGSTNVSYVLGTRGELPPSFDRRSWHGAPEGLFITAGIVLVFSTVLDLSQVASLGGLAALLVYIAVGYGHLRLRHETGARRWLLVTASSRLR